MFLTSVYYGKEDWGLVGKQCSLDKWVMWWLEEADKLNVSPFEHKPNQGKSVKSQTLLWVKYLKDFCLFVFSFFPTDIINTTDHKANSRSGIWVSKFRVRNVDVSYATPSNLTGPDLIRHMVTSSHPPMHSTSNCLIKETRQLAIGKRENYCIPNTSGEEERSSTPGCSQTEGCPPEWRLENSLDL